MGKIAVLLLILACEATFGALTRADYDVLYLEAISLTESITGKRLRVVPSLFVGTYADILAHVGRNEPVIEALGAPTLGGPGPAMYLHESHTIAICTTEMDRRLKGFLERCKGCTERTIALVVFVHELTHALLAENSELFEKIPSLPMGERIIALTLMEGHATFFEYRAAAALGLRNYRRADTWKPEGKSVHHEIYLKGYRFMKELSRHDPQLVWKVLREPPTDTVYLDQPHYYPLLGPSYFAKPQTDVVKRLLLLMKDKPDILITQTGVFDLGLTKAAFPDPSKKPHNLRNIGMLHFLSGLTGSLTAVSAFEFEHEEDATAFTRSQLLAANESVFGYFSSQAADTQADPLPCPEAIVTSGTARIAILQLGKYAVSFAPMSKPGVIWSTEEFLKFRARAKDAFLTQ